MQISNDLLASQGQQNKMAVTPLPLLPGEINRQNVSTAIKQASLQLREILMTLWPKEDGYSFNKRIDTVLRANTINRDTIISCWSKTEEQANDLTINFFYAKLYHRAAINELKQENINQASIFLAHLSYYLGFVWGYKRIIQNAAHSVKGPSHGGQAVRRIRQNVENRLVELLSSPPGKGWGNHYQVVSTLTMPLKNFIESNLYNEIISDTEDYILKALSNKGAPKTTYLSYQDDRKISSQK